MSNAKHTYSQKKSGCCVIYRGERDKKFQDTGKPGEALFLGMLRYKEKAVPRWGARESNSCIR